MECNGCEFHPELFYDDEFQVWLRREDDDTLTVGMTDLAQTIAGKIIHVRVRRPGTRRPPGKPVATIESGKWAGPVPNFIDCTIVEANSQVLENPVLLNSDPYNAWIARVEAVEGADAALRAFLTGDEAEDGYCHRVRDEDIHCQRSTR
ncbi:Glycine cleavage system H protein - like protein [Thioalkalivibrio nitratireducens DSM 14787]|uniref:Glycine cleavage system H protein-like protein n=1 Tax=Thioalkalivibrio nitratireducens (strain DSM 14787 / UNIQEM 213 / ALEN2) TaxID=1255043 RepID=L0E108_THIND|nr:glycine cleavage system protein H [Thioalkalivibrio nitratireducens]AGA34880.1 Glycine cleavage system H protein - like protein [Thioalkalivibrio nitratireducens DSM 14787]